MVELRSTGRPGAAVPAWFVVGTGLVEIDFLESKALQQAGDRLTGVLLGSSEDAIGQGGLEQLPFSLLPHLRFQIGIGGHEQAGLPGIHSRPCAVEPRAEYLRRGEVQVDLLALYLDVARLQAGEVNPGYDFSVDQK